MHRFLCFTSPSRVRKLIRGLFSCICYRSNCILESSAVESAAELPSTKPAAIVNGTNISDAELADATCQIRITRCWPLINKVIIEQACERNGVAVTT